MIARMARSAPLFSPARIIEYAARSFTDPPGLNHSALAANVTCGNSPVTRAILISGVFPMRSSKLAPTGSVAPGFGVDTSGLFAAVTMVTLGSERFFVVR